MRTARQKAGFEGERRIVRWRRAIPKRASALWLPIRRSGTRNGCWVMSAPGRRSRWNDRTAVVTSSARRLRRLNASTSAGLGCASTGARESPARERCCGTTAFNSPGQSMRTIPREGAPGGRLSRARTTCSLTLARDHGSRLAVGWHPGLRHRRFLAWLISVWSSWQHTDHECLKPGIENTNSSPS